MSTEVFWSILITVYQFLRMAQAETEVMRMNLDQQIIQELCTIADQYHIKKIVLFGSRAGKNSHVHSDIDLAVYGITSAAQYLDFQEAVEGQVHTLLQFDLVDMNAVSVSDALRDEIKKDGVVLYEKV